MKIGYGHRMKQTLIVFLLVVVASCDRIAPSETRVSQPADPPRAPNAPAQAAPATTVAPKPAPRTPIATTEDWNDAQIPWKGYDEGLKIAADEKKPVCLVFFTTWCPHCKNYSKVFSDPRVVEASKSFVMIKLDKVKYPQVSQKFAPDGEYIPRTYFLSSAGNLDPTSTHRGRSSNISTMKQCRIGARGMQQQKRAHS